MASWFARGLRGGFRSRWSPEGFDAAQRKPFGTPGRENRCCAPYGGAAARWKRKSASTFALPLAGQEPVPLPPRVPGFEPLCAGWRQPNLRFDLGWKTCCGIWKQKAASMTIGRSLAWCADFHLSQDLRCFEKQRRRSHSTRSLPLAAARWRADWPAMPWLAKRSRFQISGKEIRWKIRRAVGPVHSVRESG